MSGNALRKRYFGWARGKRLVLAPTRGHTQQKLRDDRSEKMDRDPYGINVGIQSLHSKSHVVNDDIFEPELRRNDCVDPTLTCGTAIPRPDSLAFIDN